MDYDSLSTDAPVPVLAIICWVVATWPLIAIILIEKIRSKKPDLVHLPAGLPAIAGASIVALAICGFFVLGAAQVAAQDADFHNKLSSDYGLQTESSAYAVKAAAEDGRTVEMSDETGDVDIRPYLKDGKLTFFKLDKGIPITPQNHTTG